MHCYEEIISYYNPNFMTGNCENCDFVTVVWIHFNCLKRLDPSWMVLLKSSWINVVSSTMFQFNTLYPIKYLPHFLIHFRSYGLLNHWQKWNNCGSDLNKKWIKNLILHQTQGDICIYILIWIPIPNILKVDRKLKIEQSGSKLHLQLFFMRIARKWI